MTDMQVMLEQTLERFFAQAVDAAGQAGGFSQDLWDGIDALGLTRALAAEDDADPGVGWPDVLVVLRAAGRHAAPLPLAETIIASWLAAGAGLDVPGGALSLIDIDEACEGGEAMSLTSRAGVWLLSGRGRRVPWGRIATAAVAAVPHDGQLRLVVAPCRGAEVTNGNNLAGEWRDELVFRDHPVQSAPLALQSRIPPLRLFGGLARAAQMTGALERVLESTVRYVNERQQFGKPLGKFQAVQHSLAVLAGEVAASGVATEAAFDAVEAGGDPGFLTAVAKIRAGEAAAQGIALGHQLHGAIGFTLEYKLQRLTRRLMSWRTEFGASREWAVGLGQQVLDWGADAFWPKIAAL